MPETKTNSCKQVNYLDSISLMKKTPFLIQEKVLSMPCLLLCETRLHLGYFSNFFQSCRMVQHLKTKPSAICLEVDGGVFIRVLLCAPLCNTLLLFCHAAFPEVLWSLTATE